MEGKGEIRVNDGPVLACIRKTVDDQEGVEWFLYMNEREGVGKLGQRGSEQTRCV